MINVGMVGMGDSKQSFANRRAVSPVLSYFILILAIMAASGLLYASVTGFSKSAIRIASKVDVLDVEFVKVGDDRWINVTIENYGVAPVRIERITINGSAVFDDDSPAVITYDDMAYQGFTTGDDIGPNERGKICIRTDWLEDLYYRVVVLTSNGETKLKRCHA